MNFNSLIQSFTPTIFNWSFYCDFPKVDTNTFGIKVQLNLLNSLLGEANIDEKFLQLVHEYPNVKRVLPLLIAVRDPASFIVEKKTERVFKIDHLFKVRTVLTPGDEKLLLDFFYTSGLRSIFTSKKISNLVDYIFGVEVGLDSNGRKNRSGKIMEGLVREFVEDFCNSNGYHFKEQATVNWIKTNWGQVITSEKSQRKFDFAIYNGSDVFLIETNFFGGGGSKLKTVGGEFSDLYGYMKKQGKKFFWITDGSIGWATALRPLEDAYNRMDGNIYNLAMLKEGVLEKIIK